MRKTIDFLADFLFAALVVYAFFGVIFELFIANALRVLLAIWLGGAA